MQVEPGFAGEFQEVKRRAVAAFRDGLGPYAAFPEALRRALPRDALWVRDVTISNSSWGNRIFPVYGPRDAVHPVSAAIGPGLPMGIGAALAGKGRKAIAMVGDGGFALNQTELWTAVQERAELIVMVMNDRGYGVIKHIQGALQDGRFYYADPMLPDLVKLAAVAGMPATRVASAEEMAAAVERAAATPGPSLIDVDMAAIGAFPPYAPYSQMGVWAKRAAAE
jgi:acetolactate synthase-1/2/3 large subunit